MINQKKNNKNSYFVRGELVFKGSERNLEIQNELEVIKKTSKTGLKKQSEFLKKLGQDLLKLPKSKLIKLDLPENILAGLSEYKTLNNFEAKRRQIQYIGKLMRELNEDNKDKINLIQKVLNDENFIFENQKTGINKEEVKNNLININNLAEIWLNKLIENDKNLNLFLQEFKEKINFDEINNLRNLIRNQRKNKIEKENKTQKNELNKLLNFINLIIKNK